MVAPLPSQTITGTTAADIRASTPGTDALVETFQAGDTITLNNDGDYALAGDGADTIYVGGTASVSLENSVVAGFGQDTISIGSAAGSLASNGSYIAGNQGDDYITFTAAANTSILNGAFIGGGLNSDTIAISNISQSINTSVKGGDNGDSISVLSGILTNSTIEGNKGADTIRVGISASTNASIGGGLGQDTITIGTAQAANLSFVNGGGGTDSIRIDFASTIPTVVGGGLADTISFGANFAGGRIYGDGNGVTTSGSGTGGTADGADLIGATGTTISTAASIYGAGGNDSIRFNQAAAALSINGGDGSDSIFVQDATTGSTIAGGLGGDTITLLTAAEATSLTGAQGNDLITVAAATALNLSGGKGSDSLFFTNAAGTLSVSGGEQDDLIRVATGATSINVINGSGTVDGGDGADTIQFQAFATAAGVSVTGGAGNDSISLSTAQSVADFSAIGTINGGAGTDTISIASTGGVGIGSAISAGVASIAYEAGDSIQILTTAVTAGEAFAGIVFNGSTAGIAGTAISASTAGSLNVYSDGTDTYFAFTVATGSGIAFRVTGADLVSTSALDNQINAVDTTNFGFTLSADAGSGITLNLV